MSAKRKQLDDTGKWHTDDITALAISEDRNLVASGQNGVSPEIIIWDANTAAQLCTKRMPKGSRLCTAIAMSPDAQIIYASDAAEKPTVHLFKTNDQSEKPYASVQISKKITDISASSIGAAVTGKDFATFISIDKGGNPQEIKCKQGKDPVSFSSAAFTSDGTILTGGVDGCIYAWKPQSGEKMFKVDTGSKSIQTIACFPMKDADLCLVGGKEGTLIALSYQKGELGLIWTIDVGSKPRSIDYLNDTILLGLKNGSIVEMPMSQDGNSVQRTVMSSHCDGEVWGLEVINLPGGEIRVITSADDNRIICYDGKTHQKLASGSVGEKKAKVPKKKRRAGASSMSSLPEELQSRCIAYCKSKNHLAVAANDGKVTIREINWEHIEKDMPGCLEDVLITLFSKLKRAEWIETMEYSPNEKYLAVGSHDNNIYLVETGAYK